MDSTVKSETKYISDTVYTTVTKSEDIKYKSFEKKYISDQKAVEEP